jgi:putative tricarboxylic transport membrane protein
MDSLKPLVTRTRVEGLVIFVVALAYIWEAHNVPEFYQIPGVPGPTTFPYLLGLVFAACGLWLLVSPKDLMGQLAKIREARTAPAAAGEPRQDILTRISSEWHLVAMWAVIIAYLWFMPDIGFPLSTFLLLTVFFWLLGETRWMVVLGLALTSTVVIYVLFKMGLNVRLPLGVLEFLNGK